MCERRINFYVWKNVVHERKCVQTKQQRRKLWVANSHSEVHDFHEQASGFFIKIIVPLRAIIGFVSNLRQIHFGKCETFFQISTSSGLL